MSLINKMCCPNKDTHEWGCPADRDVTIENKWTINSSTNYFLPHVLFFIFSHFFSILLRLRQSSLLHISQFILQLECLWSWSLRATIKKGLALPILLCPCSSLTLCSLSFFNMKKPTICKRKRKVEDMILQSGFMWGHGFVDEVRKWGWSIGVCETRSACSFAVGKEHAASGMIIFALLLF